MGASGRVIVAAAACAGLLAAAAPASADFRFAEPGGDGQADSCAEDDPCDLEDAVENASVNDGDEVFVLPGDYLLDTQTLTIADAIDVHGIAGAPRPRLISPRWARAWTLRRPVHASPRSRSSTRGRTWRSP